MQVLTAIATAVLAPVQQQEPVDEAGTEPTSVAAASAPADDTRKAVQKPAVIDPTPGKEVVTVDGKKMLPGEEVEADTVFVPAA